MKNIILLFAILLTACEIPEKTVTVTVPADLPIYTPLAMAGATANVLRAPRGMISSRGVIAEDDPLLGACNEPGTLYMFYSEGALVQYIPQTVAGYPQLAMAGRLTCEAHNSVSPESDWWDYVTVSAPGHIYDLSHDPEIAPLTLRYLDNSGGLAVSNSGSTFEYTFSLADYQSFVNADGSPKTILRQDFEAFGANDGIHVIHMQLGGDGLTIPSATFHF